MDWSALRKEYVTGNATLGELSERYGIGRGTLGKRAAREEWKARRKAWRVAAEKKGEGSPEEVRELKLAQMETVSRELLEKISLAIQQLDLQVLREVRKEKEIFYENPQRSDKATKEVLVEREILTQVRSPVDRNGIKVLAAALKDVKEVQMLRDPADLREQEAKIAKLQKEVREEESEGSLLVTFSREAEEYSR